MKIQPAKQVLKSMGTNVKYAFEKEDNLAGKAPTTPMLNQPL